MKKIITRIKRQYPVPNCCCTYCYKTREKVKSVIAFTTIIVILSIVIYGVCQLQSSY